MTAINKETMMLNLEQQAQKMTSLIRTIQVDEHEALREQAEIEHDEAEDVKQEMDAVYAKMIGEEHELD
jgi:hypothetical protein